MKFPLVAASLVFSLSITLGQSINYQGRLTDTDGEPVNDTVNISLKIYDSEAGGSVLYSEEVGLVKVVNGLYAFEFGETGKSLVELSEIIEVTNSAKKVYNFDTKYKPLVGEVTITDGSKSWSSVTGSSDSNYFIGSVNAGLGNVSGIYTTDAPASGLFLKVTYFCEFGGINRTLGDLGKKYLEVSIDGSPLSQRELLTGAPYAHTAGSVVNFFKSIEPLEVDFGVYYTAESDVFIFGAVGFGPNNNAGGSLTIAVRDHVNSEERVFSSGTSQYSRSTFAFVPIRKGESYKINISNCNFESWVVKLDD